MTATSPVCVAGGGHVPMAFIFVSYRRTDAPAHAGRLYDRLVQRFGEANVFKDLDSMEPGADFVEVIEETVGRCDALLAVIGRGWLAAEEDERRRLDDPQDWVRLELANALERKIRVVPVLVQGASMPSAADLPDDIKPLTRRHAFELSETAWSAQLNHLIDALARALQPRPSASRPERHEPSPTPARAAPEGRPGWTDAVPDDWREVVRIPAGGLLEFSPDGSVLVTEANDDLQLWDTTTGLLRRTLRAEPAEGHNLLYVNLSPDGRFIGAVGMASRGEWVWEIDSGRLVHTVPGRAETLVFGGASIFSPGGRYYAAPELASQLWETDGWQEVCDLGVELRAPLAFGAADAWIAVAEESSPRARIWALDTGRELTPLEHGGKASITSIKAHPSDEELILAVSDSHATIWHLRNGAVAQILFAKPGRSRPAAWFSPMGAYIRVHYHDAGSVWETSSGRLLSVISGWRFYESEFTPDDRLLLTCGGGRATVWDLASQQQIVALEGRSEFKTDHHVPHLSACGRVAATTTTGYPPIVRIWELQTGRELFRLDFATSFEFSPRDACLAASDDEETRLYRAGEPLASR